MNKEEVLQAIRSMPDCVQEEWRVQCDWGNEIVFRGNETRGLLYHNVMLKVPEGVELEIKITSNVATSNFIIRYVFPDFWITHHITLSLSGGFHSCIIITQ